MSRTRRAGNKIAALDSRWTGKKLGGEISQVSLLRPGAPGFSLEVGWKNGKRKANVRAIPPFARRSEGWGTQFETHNRDWDR